MSWVRMSGKEDAYKLLEKLESHLDELPMHLYIFIWAVSEMDQRYQSKPVDPEFDKICYPFTNVPLFSKEEGVNLEGLWSKNVEPNKGLFTEPQQTPGSSGKPQSGGRLPSFSQLKKKAVQFGQVANFAVKALDPKLLSPDYLFDYTTELFDTVDAGLTEASSTFGLVALESTLPDPTIIIPVVPPLPVSLPGRTILPFINAVLEAIRIALGVASYVDPLGISSIPRILVTLVMVLLDIGRGNLYHAIFTSFGFIGSTPMFVGIVLKIIRDAIMLVSPDLRTQIRYLLFQSSKSVVVGFAIWLFTTLSPQFIKLPLKTLFDTVAVAADNINDKLDMAEMNINLSPAGKLATIKLPRIPGDKIPDINNLYALREAIREPAIFCDPKIADLMNELRNVPPYALFFDLALLPRVGTAQFAEQCAPYKGGTMADNLAAAITPQIIPKIPLETGMGTEAYPGAPVAAPVPASPEAYPGAPVAAPVPASPEAYPGAPVAAPVPALSEAPVPASPEGYPGAPVAAPVPASPEAPVPASSEAPVSASPEATVPASPEATVPASPEATVPASPEAPVGAPTDPKAAALSALVSSSPTGALAAQALTDPKAAALSALASSSPKGALAAQALTDPKAAALGALASSSPWGALAAQMATSPSAATLLPKSKSVSKLFGRRK